MNSLGILRKYEPSGLVDHEVPVVWDRAEGYYVWDVNGKQYIDFTSGIFVANVGHRHPKVVSAVENQMSKCLYSYIFPTEIRAKLVQKLLGITHMDKCILTVTGSEANEAALQMMLRNRRGDILSIKGAYYGSTSGIRKLNNGDIDENTWPEDLIRLDHREIAGIFLQCFRGRDCKWMPFEWMQRWVEWAHKYAIPIAFDEMQSGVGRTGKWFGYEHYGIQPDLLCIGKAFGGGLPISCVMGRSNLLSLADDLWSTHSGNPVCCAAALATFEVIEEEWLLQKAIDIGETIYRQLVEYCHVNSLGLFGRGAIWALHFQTDGVYDIKLVDRIVGKAAEKGLLLVSTHAGTIKIAPPLTTSLEIVEQGCQILKEAIQC